VTSFSEALRAELRGSDVAVTIVCPGPVKTEFGIVAERKGTTHYNLPQMFDVPVEQVAQEALAAAANDRARVVPGLLVAVVIGCICALPFFVLRFFLNRGAR
jgi:short-subunit dehydrogenase